MQSVRVRHYLDRAADFLRGMNFVRGDAEFTSSSALLAIHSAVSYTDAIRSGLGDEQLSDEDHGAAVAALKGLLTTYRGDQKGIAHLEYLISKKTSVAYGSKRLSPEVYQMLILKAERYATWVNAVGRHLGIEGWTHDDQ